jgi:hypothetical protein
LKFVYALKDLEEKASNDSGIHLHRVVAQMAVDCAKQGSSAPSLAEVQAIAANAVGSGVATASTPFHYKSTADFSDLILFVAGVNSFDALLLLAQTDKRFDDFFAALAAGLESK